jgi:hypothetical protein
LYVQSAQKSVPYGFGTIRHLNKKSAGGALFHVKRFTFSFVCCCYFRIKTAVK